MSDSLSPRQIVALKAVQSKPGAIAKDVAEAIQPGSDPRGAAQTLRRLSPIYVTRTADGHYDLTPAGVAAVR